MYKSIVTHSLSALCLISLSACATLTKTDVLLSGISPAEASKPFPAGQMRAATDPVCVNFYKNSRAYIAQTNKPHRGKKFLTSVGVGVLAGVASRSIGVGGIESGLGKIAAQQAVSRAVRHGSVVSMQEIKSSSQSAQIEKAATALHCPVIANP